MAAYTILTTCQFDLKMIEINYIELLINMAFTHENYNYFTTVSNITSNLINVNYLALLIRLNKQNV